jgi:MFS family permease
VWWLAVYGFLMGLGGGALLTYLPLYAQEGLGLTVTQAGIIVGVVGFVALLGRVGWSALSERVSHFGGVLALLALMASAATVLLRLAPALGVGMLWAGALLAALSSSSWNSVAMLAVMQEAGPSRAGSASGVVLLGFLGGLAIGPPIFGYSVDATGSYRTGFLGMALVFFVSAVVASWWLRRVRRVTAPVTVGES